MAEYDDEYIRKYSIGDLVRYGESEFAYKSEGVGIVDKIDDGYHSCTFEYRYEIRDAGWFRGKDLALLSKVKK